MNPLRIAVVCGGSSPEAEVSRSSANGVAKALKATWPDVTLVELDASAPAALLTGAFDVVFPVLHGPPGEDGTFQGFLETIGVPYVGSGVLASACAMDKIVAKQIYRAYRLPIAREVIVGASQPLDASMKRIVATLGNDVVVKPARQGSALGVGFASDRPSLEQALQTALSFGDDVLVEERIRGKEITVAVLDRPEPEALAVVEVATPSGTWYDFEHRYTSGLSEHIIPAELPAETARRTAEVAVAAHRALGCRDLSRSDFVVPEQGEPCLLETNTLPGMTPTSLFPDAARAAGLSFEALVRHLVERAVTRAGRRDSAA